MAVPDTCVRVKSRGGERWVSVFSSYQEMKFAAVVLFSVYVPGIHYLLKKKKVVMSFLYISVPLWLSECVVNSFLQALFCHNPFRIRKLKKNQPREQHGVNSNDLSFSINGSNKHLIYIRRDTRCRLIKNNVLLADHLLRENKLKKDKLSCHVIN